MSTEVAVVGAGPAGCAAAAAASLDGRSVVLLDPFDDHPVGRGGRVGEATAPGTPQLLAEIFGPGVQSFTAEDHIRSPGTVSAWGTAEPAVTEHLFNPLGLSWTLDRDRFDDGLRAAAAHLGVEHRAARVTGLERDGGWWIIESAGDGGHVGTLRTRVVIDAGGRGARIARSRGARQRHLDHLVALWTRWSVDAADERSSLYVESARGGWWYSALVPGRRRMVVHLTDADLVPTDPLARRDLALSARRLPLIGRLLEATPGPDLVEGPWLTVARSSWLDRTSGPGWLATGDAACTVDPLSGRGIVSALLTGRTSGRAASAMVSGHGGTRGAEEHRSLVTQLLLDGSARQAEAYRAEGRWPTAPFWSRRLAAPRPPGVPAAGLQEAGLPPPPRAAPTPPSGRAEPVEPGSVDRPTFER